ncbi:hypothetical protein [Actinomarinicola tropica]|uniref:Uncharacterized protein n=1 Tax=Actinomarinicola tropica TaxID=2789776 RepID=A0A5Q2RPB2_9ACTN|nr:hypothetical protein [Actinomarinicola tropica]QGG95720.1 hypothetical protein GH723_11775 [Actinomarinicola tropica]
MDDHAPQGRPPRRTPPALFLLALSAVAVVAAIAVAVVVGGDDDAPNDAAGSGGEAASPTVQSLPPECENLHAGHGIAMWNSAMADEMTTAGCPFPYEPFIPPMEGGEEDPSIDAPFEPRLYADIWQMLSDADLGLCQVTTLPEDSVDGLVFGFRYVAGAAGCPELEGDVALEVREYATRAWRDARAHDAEAPRTFVLGRWVIGVAPTGEGGETAVRAVAEGLGGLGAVELT